MISHPAQPLPDQADRVVIVTGANSGLGFATARALAGVGAHVILACRSVERGAQAAHRIQQAGAPGGVLVQRLDLGSLESVAGFADRIHERYQKVDLLVNNAGVMVPPLRFTEDGFELQIGVNFLGHFALTGRLIDLLAAAPGSRVVTLSSLAHKFGRIDLESFHRRAFDTGTVKYRPMRAYAQSKLADLMFAIQLQRRLGPAGTGPSSIAAHPGVTRTRLQRHSGLSRVFVRLWSMTPEQGARPTLFAATAGQAEPGGYYGPQGFGEMTGPPGPARIAARASDVSAGDALFSLAERLTGVSFPRALP